MMAPVYVPPAGLALLIVIGVSVFVLPVLASFWRDDPRKTWGL
jgi:hypothetical protein